MHKPLGRELRDLFFHEDATAAGASGALDGARIYRCKCGETRTEKPGEGRYAVFTEHIVSEHEEWLAASVRGAGAGAGAASASNGSVEEQSSEEIEAPAVMEASRALVTHKRSDYLPWDDYFMSVAFLSAMRSKDPSTQVGACIVNPERKIVGIGYNGFPNGCSDDELPWSRSSASGSPLETKYPFVCHAEMNAILNKNSTDVKGCTIYVALFPCNECAKLIIQSGIARVVYCSDKYRDDWKFVASRRLLAMAGVQCTQHSLRQSQVVIDFSSVE